MKPRLIITFAVLIFMNLSLLSQDGAALFKQNCGVCHTVGKGKLVGPDLKDVHTKYKEEWLMNWIKSSQAMVKKGDPTAVKLFEENNKLVMPDQSVTEDQIKTILAFVKETSEKPVEVVSTEKPKEITPVGARPEFYDYKKKESNPLSWKAATFVLAGFCVILVIVVIALANTIGGMAKGIKGPVAENVSPATDIKS